jgi:hypothetical protein
LQKLIDKKDRRSTPKQSLFIFKFDLREDAYKGVLQLRHR